MLGAVRLDLDLIDLAEVGLELALIITIYIAIIGLCSTNKYVYGQKGLSISTAAMSRALPSLCDI